MNSITISHFRMVDSPVIKAVCSILIDGNLAVHDIRLLQYSPKRIIVAMPTQQDGKGKPRDVVHPINQETRQQLEALLIGEYQKRQIQLEE